MLIVWYANVKFRQASLAYIFTRCELAQGGWEWRGVAILETRYENIWPSLSYTGQLSQKTGTIFGQILASFGIQAWLSIAQYCHVCWIAPLCRSNNLFCYIFHPGVWTWNLWQVKRQTASSLLCSGQFYKRPLVNYICLGWVRPPWWLSRYAAPSHSLCRNFLILILLPGDFQWLLVTHIWGIDIPLFLIAINIIFIFKWRPVGWCGDIYVCLNGQGLPGCPEGIITIYNL